VGPAQELIEPLAGANPNANPNYRSRAMKELNNLKSKVILLNETLDNFDVARGGKFVLGYAHDERQSLLVRLYRLRIDRNGKIFPGPTRS
jgi:ADP-ribosylation factor-binding protein GGA